MYLSACTINIYQYVDIYRCLVVYYRQHYDLCITIGIITIYITMYIY